MLWDPDGYHFPFTFNFPLALSEQTMIGFCLCDGYLDIHSWLPNKSSNLKTSLSINPAHDCFVSTPQASPGSTEGRVRAQSSRLGQVCFQIVPSEEHKASLAKCRHNSAQNIILAKYKLTHSALTWQSGICINIFMRSVLIDRS